MFGNRTNFKSENKGMPFMTASGPYNIITIIIKVIQIVDFFHSF